MHNVNTNKIYFSPLYSVLFCFFSQDQFVYEKLDLAFRLRKNESHHPYVYQFFRDFLFSPQSLTTRFCHHETEFGTMTINLKLYNKPSIGLEPMTY